MFVLRLTSQTSLFLSAVRLSSPLYHPDLVYFSEMTELSHVTTRYNELDVLPRPNLWSLHCDSLKLKQITDLLTVSKYNSRLHSK